MILQRPVRRSLAADHISLPPRATPHRYEPSRDVRTMAYDDHERGGRHYGGEYRQAAWQHDSRDGYEEYRRERGRDIDRHDHDEGR